MKQNVISEKSYSFAIRIVKLNKYLKESKREYILSNQVFRSGTSIGANIEEALGGQSDKDFINKLSVAYKEARETQYWIRLLCDSDYLTKMQAESLLIDCEELLRIIGSIQITMRKKSNS